MENKKKVYKIIYKFQSNKNFLTLYRHNKNNKNLVEKLKSLKSQSPSPIIAFEKTNKKEEKKQINQKDEIQEIKEIKIKEKQLEDEEEFVEVLEEEIDSNLLSNDDYSEPLPEDIIIKQLFNHYIRETNKFNKESSETPIKDQLNYYKSKYINNRKKVINKLIEECIVSVDEMTIEKLISYGYDQRYFNSELVTLMDAIEMLKLINSPQESVKLFVVLECFLLFNNNIRAIHSINTHELSNFKKRLSSDISPMINSLIKYINISNNNKKLLINSIEKLESLITKNYYDEIIKNTSFFKIKEVFNSIESLSIRCPDIYLLEKNFKQLNYCGKNSNLYPPEMPNLKLLHIQGHYINKKLNWIGSNKFLIDYIIKQSIKLNQLQEFIYDINNNQSITKSSTALLLDNSIVQSLIKYQNSSLKLITFRLLFINNNDKDILLNELINLNQLIKQSISKYTSIQINIELPSPSSQSIVDLVIQQFRDIDYNIEKSINLDIIRLNHK